MVLSACRMSSYQRDDNRRNYVNNGTDRPEGLKADQTPPEEVFQSPVPDLSPLTNPNILQTSKRSASGADLNADLQKSIKGVSAADLLKGLFKDGPFKYSFIDGRDSSGFYNAVFSEIPDLNEECKAFLKTIPFKEKFLSFVFSVFSGGFKDPVGLKVEEHFSHIKQLFYMLEDHGLVEGNCVTDKPDLVDARIGLYTPTNSHQSYYLTTKGRILFEVITHQNQ